jgi:hypothetical protein
MKFIVDPGAFRMVNLIDNCNLHSDTAIFDAKFP